MLTAPGGTPARSQASAKQEEAQRRILGRFQHHRVAGHERAGDGARAHRQRPVPRHDLGRDAEGLVHRVVDVAVAQRDLPPFELVGQAGVVGAGSAGSASPRSARSPASCRCRGIPPRAISSAALPSSSATFSIRSPRRCGRTSRSTRLSKQARAARTARSMSAGVPRATSAMSSPVAGSVTVMRRAVAAIHPVAADAVPPVGPDPVRHAPAPSLACATIAPPAARRANAECRSRHARSACGAAHPCGGGIGLVGPCIGGPCAAPPYRCPQDLLPDRRDASQRPPARRHPGPHAGKQPLRAGDHGGGFPQARLPRGRRDPRGPAQRRPETSHRDQGLLRRHGRARAVGAGADPRGPRRGGRAARPPLLRGGAGGHAAAADRGGAARRGLHLEPRRDDHDREHRPGRRDLLRRPRHRRDRTCR